MDLDIKAAVRAVKTDMKNMSLTLLKELPNEVLDSILGEKERKRIRSRTKSVKQKEVEKDLPTSTERSGKRRKRRESKSKDPMALWKQLNEL